MSTTGLAMMLSYNVAIVAGFAYLVGWKGWDPWWMVFPLLLVMSSK